MEPDGQVKLRTLVLGAMLAASALGSGACTTPSTPDQYYWGSYEACVAGLCRDPGGAHLQEEIRSLSSDIEKARVQGRPVAPGVHAHLGYLYYLGGNYESAALEFTAEKELYPESTVFIDGMLKRMKK